MKILHIVQRYAPAYGGSEQYMQVISEYFARGGHDVEVWTSDALDLDAFWNLKKERVRVKEERINNVLVKRFSVAPSLLNNFWIHKAFRVFLRRIPIWDFKILASFPYVFGMLKYALSKKRWDFDVIHVCSFPYAILFYIALKLLKRSHAKLIITPFIHLGEKKNDPVRKIFFRKEYIPFFEKADTVIFQTEAEKNAIIEFMSSYGKEIEKQKFIKLGMGITRSEIMGGDGKRFRKKYGISKNEIVVFYVGARVRDKGVFNLVTSCIKLWKEGERFKLVLAGMENLEFVRFWERVKDEYKKNIVLITSPTDVEKFDIFDGGDIFSMVSRSDSFGIVYLEAWSYKKPVIACNTKSISQIISNGKDGFLLRFNDIKGQKEVIKRLIKDKRLRNRLGESGFKKVEKEYLWEKKFPTLKKIY